ncbi:uncharacterized protein LOC141909223 [Tubulanus polymorphus]|uniref:uncharacterized protein LOC141909223 n=1 Tax=Tubulanus polymorphus TaxID=672921 RepID=UPI003DA6C4AC
METQGNSSDGDEMPRDGHSLLNDGAFERFISSALATILTLIFSWRILLDLEHKESSRLMIEDTGDNEREKRRQTAREIADENGAETERKQRLAIERGGSCTQGIVRIIQTGTAADSNVCCGGIPVRRKLLGTNVDTGLMEDCVEVDISDSFREVPNHHFRHHEQYQGAAGFVTDLDAPMVAENDDRDLYGEMAAMVANHRLHRHYCSYENDEFYCSSDEELDIYGRRMLDTISEEDDDELPSSVDENNAWLNDDIEEANSMEYDAEWTTQNDPVNHGIRHQYIHHSDTDPNHFHHHPHHLKHHQYHHPPSNSDDDAKTREEVVVHSEAKLEKPAPVRNAAVRALELLKACDDQARDDSLLEWKERNYNISAPPDSDEFSSPNSSVNKSDLYLWDSPISAELPRYYDRLETLQTHEPREREVTTNSEQLAAKTGCHDNADAENNQYQESQNHNTIYTDIKSSAGEKSRFEIYSSEPYRRRVPLACDYNNETEGKTVTADDAINNETVPVTVNDSYLESISNANDARHSSQTKQWVGSIGGTECINNNICANQDIKPNEVIAGESIRSKPNDEMDSNMYVQGSSRTSDYDSGENSIDSPVLELVHNDIAIIQCVNSDNGNIAPVYCDSQLSSAKHSPPKGFIFVKTTEEDVDYSVHSTVVYKKYHESDGDAQQAEIGSLSVNNKSDDDDIFEGENSGFIIRRDSADSDISNDYNPTENQRYVDLGNDELLASAAIESTSLFAADVNKCDGDRDSDDGGGSSASSTTTADTAIEVQISGLSSPRRSPLRSPKIIPIHSQTGSLKSIDKVSPFSAGKSDVQNNLSSLEKPSTFRGGIKALKREPANREVYLDRTEGEGDTYGDGDEDSNSSSSSTEESFDLSVQTSPRENRSSDNRSIDSGQRNIINGSPICATRTLGILEELSESNSSSSEDLSAVSDADKKQIRLELESSGLINLLPSQDKSHGESLFKNIDTLYVNELNTADGSRNDTPLKNGTDKNSLDNNHGEYLNTAPVCSDDDEMANSPGLEAIMAKYGIKPRLRSASGQSDFGFTRPTRALNERPISSILTPEIRDGASPSSSNYRPDVVTQPGYVDATAQTVRSYRLPARLFALNPERYFIEYPVETTTFITEERIGGRTTITEHKEQGVQVEFDPTGARERAEKHGDSDSASGITTHYLHPDHQTDLDDDTQSDPNDNQVEAEVKTLTEAEPSTSDIDLDGDSPFRPVGASSPLPGFSPPAATSSPVRFKPINPATTLKTDDQQMAPSPAVSSPTPSDSTNDNQSPLSNNSLHESSPKGARGFSPARSASPEWRTEEWTEVRPTASYDVTPASMDRSRSSAEMELEVDRALRDVQGRIQQWNEAYKTSRSPSPLDDESNDNLKPAEEKWRHSPWREINPDVPENDKQSLASSGEGSPLPKVEEWTVEHKVPRASLPDYLLAQIPQEDATAPAPRYEEWTVEHTLPVVTTADSDRPVSVSPMSEAVDENAAADNANSDLASSRSSTPSTRYEEWTVEHTVPIPVRGPSPQVPKLLLHELPESDKPGDNPKLLNIPSHIRAEITSSPVSTRSTSPMEESWSEEWTVEHPIPKYLLEEDVNSSYSLDSSMEVTRYDPNKPAPVADMDDEFDDISPRTPPKKVSPRNTTTMVPPPIPIRASLENKEIKQPQMTERPLIPVKPMAINVTPGKTMTPPIPPRKGVSGDKDAKTPPPIPVRVIDQKKIPEIPPRLADKPPTPTRPTIKPFGNLSKELGVSNSVPRVTTTAREQDQPRQSLKPLSPVEKKIEQFLQQEDEQDEQQPPPLPRKHGTYQSVLQEPVSKDTKNVSHLFSLPPKPTSRKQEVLKEKRSDFISSPPEVTEEEKQKALGTKDWEKRPKPILKRNRGDSDTSRNESSSTDTSFQSINYGTQSKNELPKYSLSVYPSVKDQIDGLVFKEIDIDAASPNTSRDDDVFFKTRSLPYRAKAKSLSDLLQSGSFKRRSTLPSGSGICGVRLVRSPSTNLCRTPSVFFNARAKSMTNLLETDIDTGESTVTPLVTETDIDEVFKERQSRARSLVDLRGQEPLSTSFFEERGRSWEKTRSLTYLPCNALFNFDDIDGQPERKNSEHDIRISRSLTRLDLPEWYVKSANSRSSSRPRSPANISVYSPVNANVDMDYSRHDSSFSSSSSNSRGPKPVVIQTRVSRSRSPNNRATKEAPAVPAKFELPSEKYRKKNKPKELEPIKSRLLPPSLLLQQKQAEKNEAKESEVKAVHEKNSPPSEEPVVGGKVSTPYQVRRPLVSYEIQTTRTVSSYESPSYEINQQQPVKPVTHQTEAPKLSNYTIRQEDRYSANSYESSEQRPEHGSSYSMTPYKIQTEQIAPSYEPTMYELNQHPYEYQIEASTPLTYSTPQVTTLTYDKTELQQPHNDVHSVAQYVPENRVQNNYDEFDSSPGSRRRFPQNEEPSRQYYTSDIKTIDSSPGSHRRNLVSTNVDQNYYDERQSPQTSDYQDLGQSPKPRHRQFEIDQQSEGLQILTGSPGGRRSFQTDIDGEPNPATHFQHEPQQEDGPSYEQLQMSPGARRSYRLGRTGYQSPIPSQQASYDTPAEGTRFKSSTSITPQPQNRDRPTPRVRTTPVAQPRRSLTTPNKSSIETDIDADIVAPPYDTRKPTATETNIDGPAGYTERYDAEPRRFSRGRGAEFNNRAYHRPIETNVDDDIPVSLNKPSYVVKPAVRSYETNIDDVMTSQYSQRPTQSYEVSYSTTSPTLINGRRSMETMIDDEYDFDSPASSIPPTPIFSSGHVYSTSDIDMIYSTSHSSANGPTLLTRSWSDDKVNIETVDDEEIIVTKKYDLTDVQNPDKMAQQIHDFFSMESTILDDTDHNAKSIANGLNESSNNSTDYCNDTPLAEVLDGLLALPKSPRNVSPNSDSDDDNGDENVSYDNRSRRGTLISINESKEEKAIESDALETGELRDSFGDERTIDEDRITVKCRNSKCGKTAKLSEARETFKTCHNCYTYYCSRNCRKSHWERHKKRCLYSRVNSACKHAIRYVHDHSDILHSISRTAKTGYLSLGRGTVLIMFGDANKAEQFLKNGLLTSDQVPKYCSIKEINDSGLFGDYRNTVLETCKEYNPSVKFVLTVAVLVGTDTPSKPLPIIHAGPTIQRCAKLRLSSTKHFSQRHYDTRQDKPDTLILTAVPGSSSDGMDPKHARELCFMNIQRKLRDRGVDLKKLYPFVYRQLIEYVDSDKHFSPMTIYPVDVKNGKTFMCLIMPDSDPDIEWIQSPDLIQELDLAEEY